MDYSLLLNVMIGIIFVFAPALMISAFIGFAMDNFLGLISAFMFIGASFNIIPQSFMILGILLGGIYLYMTFIRKGDNST